MKNLLALALLLINFPAFAFTPQSGMWWNPQEGGRGYTIDVQDNIVVFMAYLYNAQGKAEWYYSDGQLSADGRQFTSTLYRFEGGQCITCPYKPAANMGNAGTATVKFSTPGKGVLTWAGGSVPIERYNFRIGEAPDALIGQWVFVSTIGGVDFADRYNFTEKGSATSSGTGVVFDLVKNAVIEFVITGPFAGYVFLSDFNSAVTKTENIFMFKLIINDATSGKWVSPTNFTEYPMFGLRTKSKSGIAKAGVAQSDDAMASMKLAAEPHKTGASMSPEIAAFVERAREALKAAQQ